MEDESAQDSRDEYLMEVIDTDKDHNEVDDQIIVHWNDSRSGRCIKWACWDGFTYIWIQQIVLKIIILQICWTKVICRKINVRQLELNYILNRNNLNLNKLAETPTLRKYFVILQLYWWLFSSAKHCSWNMV